MRKVVSSENDAYAIALVIASLIDCYLAATRGLTALELVLFVTSLLIYGGIGMAGAFHTGKAGTNIVRRIISMVALVCFASLLIFQSIPPWGYIICAAIRFRGLRCTDYGDRLLDTKSRRPARRTTRPSASRSPSTATTPPRRSSARRAPTTCSPGPATARAAPRRAPTASTSSPPMAAPRSATTPRAT
jgi:hypothetical protein